eukprot:TRINITY_DN8825_c0_g1_i1.p1 TRINITY_DN8825_c0_g1~~TRINITY_DN8825_c0_g1_i1.p1  ORF type:complete len:158 (+),score=60.90 TRINITY_DN8825_c0_g1_i1:52-474(+)
MSKKKTSKQVIWDEENILYNESQRHLYGQMKIDEPKTPYEHEVEGAGAHSTSDEDDSDDEMSSALAQRLMQAQAHKKSVALSSASSSSSSSHGGHLPGDDDEDEDPEKLARKKAFLARRKAHYDEFTRVKEKAEEKNESG